MQTQTFIKEDPTTVIGAPDDQVRLTTDRIAHIEALRDGGFEHMANFVHGSRHERLDTVRVLFDELQGRDLQLWRQFLPTINADFRNFKFEVPPKEAVDAIAMAKSLDVFDRVEIWTPEGSSFPELFVRKMTAFRASLGKKLDKLAEMAKHMDPLAVGVVTDTRGIEHYFPITRWGESLQPLNKIRSYVAKVQAKAFLTFVALPMVVLIIGIGFYANAIQSNGYGNVLATTLVGVLFAVPVTMIAFLIGTMIREDIRRARRRRG